MNSYLRHLFKLFVLYQGRKDMNHSSIQSPHLLIIEHIPEHIELIEFTLIDANIRFTFDIVTTVIECKRYLAQYRYDGILSTYCLPSTNPLETFEVFKNSEQEIPFILLTGELEEEAATEITKVGITDYVLKDRMFRLPTVLQRALNEFELRRQQKSAITQLQQQAWRESIINRIVQAMRETLILVDVLQTMANLLHEALPISRCLIFQHNEEEQLRVKYVSNLTNNPYDLIGQPCPFFKHFQNVLMRGEQIAFNSIDPGLPDHVQQIASAFSVRSILITPLLYQNTYMGGISLHQCEQEIDWTENELLLVKSLAHQCAITIHQAKLYQSVQAELTERKRMEEKLRHDALHDTLTNLPNRALILDRLNHALKRFQRHSQNKPSQQPNKFAVLFLDLDRFKIINDSLGHAAGDQLLRIAAQRLSEALRAEDSLARLGGDEFVILLEEISEVNDAIEVVHRIHNLFKKPILLGHQEVMVSSSIGVVFSVEYYTHAEQLLRDADTAMYRAKSKRRGSYEIFDSSMHIEVMSQLQLENQLYRAIENQELRLYYQPIVSLQSRRLLGFEALVRWQHPEKGLISPVKFIPMAEDIGMVIAIDLWVLQEACYQLRQWQNLSAEHTSLSLSVNLSAQQFSQPELISQIDEILNTVKLDPGHLRIELTESVLIEKTSSAIEILGQFKERNIQIALDDFGTGYSSLSYLHRFPIQILKIDRSFISQLGTGLENSEIVKTILNLGRHLGLEIVAEGIETIEQVEFLRDHGCYSGQGYFFARPLKADAAIALLKQELKIQQFAAS
jgi:diguanylate cyclase (GGDEF)-like protein